MAVNFHYSNIDIIQRHQAKPLRSIISALLYECNCILHTDSRTYVNDIVKKEPVSNHYTCLLGQHNNARTQKLDSCRLQ